MPSKSIPARKPKIGKRLSREIQIASVFDSVLRERFTSGLTGYFADERPDQWNDEQREIFDVASEVEHRMKSEILRMLGVEKSSKAEHDCPSTGET